MSFPTWLSDSAHRILSWFWPRRKQFFPVEPQGINLSHTMEQMCSILLSPQVLCTCRSEAKRWSFALLSECAYQDLLCQMGEHLLVFGVFFPTVFLMKKWKPLTVNYYIKPSWTSVITPASWACSHHAGNINNYASGSINEKEEEKYCLVLQES